MKKITNLFDGKKKKPPQALVKSALRTHSKVKRVEKDAKHSTKEPYERMKKANKSMSIYNEANRKERGLLKEKVKKVSSNLLKK